MDIYNEILFSHIEEILPFTTTWMKLESIILSKNKPDIERQILHYLAYM